MNKIWILSDIVKLTKPEVLELDATTTAALKETVNTLVEKYRDISKELSVSSTNTQYRKKLNEDIRRLLQVDGWIADAFEHRNKEKIKPKSTLNASLRQSQGGKILTSDLLLGKQTS